MRVNVRTLYANSTSTPNLTLTLGSTSTGTIGIVKGNNQPLSVGDIPGSGYVAEFVYSSQFSKWILLNAYINQVTLPAGTVIQTQAASSTSGFSTNNTLGINVLSLNIVPQYANSKILVQMNCPVLAFRGESNGAFMDIYRGATLISTTYLGNGSEDAPPALGNLTSIYLDSPATTSTVTYNMVIGSIDDPDADNDACTVYGGTAVTAQQTPAYINVPVGNYSIILQEIKQ
jgi:hypothetical protein